MKHVFIDTNVFLNMYKCSSDNIDLLNQLISEIQEGKIKLYLTEQVVDEFYRNREHLINKALEDINAFEDVNTNMKREIEIDKCILAVGMKTNLDIFEDLGIETEGKYIRVDKEMRTNVEGVFAIGDIATYLIAAAHP